MSKKETENQNTDDKKFFGYIWIAKPILDGYVLCFTSEKLMKRVDANRISERDIKDPKHYKHLYNWATKFLAEEWAPITKTEFLRLQLCGYDEYVKIRDEKQKVL